MRLSTLPVAAIGIFCIFLAIVAAALGIRSSLYMIVDLLHVFDRSDLPSMVLLLVGFALNVWMFMRDPEGRTALIGFWLVVGSMVLALLDNMFK